jgi:arabinofuranan 3-O-arabinosyltransferase
MPGGDPVTVTFEYAPETSFRLALGAGAFGLLICLAGALVPPRRSVRERKPLPALRPGRAGLLDVAVVLAAGGLLVGWFGLAGIAAALVAGVVVRRFDGWSALAGAAMLLVGAGLSWDRITQETWANEWRQAWSLVAVACVVAALATTIGLPQQRRPRQPHRHALTEGPASSPPRSQTRRALQPGRRR